MIGRRVLESGCDLVAASSAALVDDELRRDLCDATMQSGARLMVPAGAVGTCDALAALRTGGLSRVIYRGIKPPAAWYGTPAEEACDLASIDRPTTFFEGSAREAAFHFPKNANAACTIGLAGIRLDATLVSLIADPAATANRHEIEAHGRHGRIAFAIDAVVSPDNPRTSAITAHSLVNCLMSGSAAVVLGPEHG